MLLDALIGAGDRVTTAIRSASQSTGTSFDYLLKTAIRESALDPKAKATTSSARGLFQFIESTWLQTVKEEGPRYGLTRHADAIERTADGRYVVRDPQMRARILKLREDPEIAAVMAGAFANRNAAELTSVLGRKPTAGELYIAHFLGAAGAKCLFKLKAGQPNAVAAAAFPEAARSNHGVFYKRDGSARSANEVYAALTARHDRAPAGPAPQPNMAVAAAAVAPATPHRPTASAKSAAPASSALPAVPPSSAAAATTWAGPVKPARTFIPSRADIRAAATAVPEHPPANPVRSAFDAEEAPVFQALFRTEPNGTLSPAVRELWGGIDPTSRRHAAVNVGREPARAPLDLSGFLKPAIGQSGRRTRLGT
jgi:hypothetical protein